MHRISQLLPETSLMANERFVDIPEGSIHCIAFPGLGPEAHFSHANGCCAGTYAPFLKHLAGRLDIVASDLRGHGDTCLPVPEPLRHWAVFADDMKAFIETAMTPPVIGMGHSLGAVVTFLAAARYPHLFSKIVLIDPVMLPRQYLLAMALLWRLGWQGRMPLARLARRRKRVFSNKDEARRRFTSGRGMFKTWQPAFIDAYLGCALAHGDDGIATLKCDPELEAQIYESVPRDIWKTAGRVRCPILALRGAQSDTFLSGAAHRLVRLGRDCRIGTIPGTGHFLPMEAPHIVSRAIAQWCGKDPYQSA